MMIAAAVVPHPPVLVPEIAQGLTPDLDPLRAACAMAIDRLYAAQPDEILIVGSGPRASTDVAAAGSFREYGLDLEVHGRWAAAAGAEKMTLPFLIGAWLLRDHPDVPPRHALMVDGAAATTDFAGLPKETTGRRALLVLGDGSASRTPQAPGHYDERAEPYDRSVAQALAAADTKALAALDPDLSRQVHAAGLPAWQALAAAADASGVEYDAELLYDDAPYGVGYFVASWIAR